MTSIFRHHKKHQIKSSENLGKKILHNDGILIFSVFLVGSQLALRHRMNTRSTKNNLNTTKHYFFIILKKPDFYTLLFIITESQKFFILVYFTSNSPSTLANPSALPETKKRKISLMTRFQIIRSTTKCKVQQLHAIKYRDMDSFDNKTKKSVSSHSESHRMSWFNVMQRVCLYMAV